MTPFFAGVESEKGFNILAQFLFCFDSLSEVPKTLNSVVAPPCYFNIWEL